MKEKHKVIQHFQVNFPDLSPALSISFIFNFFIFFSESTKTTAPFGPVGLEGFVCKELHWDCQFISPWWH